MTVTERTVARMRGWAGGKTLRCPIDVSGLFPRPEAFPCWRPEAADLLPPARSDPTSRCGLSGNPIAMAMALSIAARAP